MCMKVLNIKNVGIKYSKYVYNQRVGKDFLNQIAQEVIKTKSNAFYKHEKLLLKKYTTKLKDEPQ